MLWLRARSLGGAIRSAGSAPRDPTREASGERAPTAAVAPDSPPATAAGACSSIVLEVRSLDRGGIESVVVELALALGAEGISTAVVCTERGGSEVERLRSAGVEVVVLGAADRSAELAAWLDGRTSTCGTRITPISARHSRPCAASRRRHHPQRVRVGSEPPDDAFRRIDAVVDAYVAVSESAAAFAAARFAIARERIRVIRNALSRQAALASAASPRPRAAPRLELGSASPKRPSSWSRSAASIPSSRRWSWSTPWAALAPSRRRLVAWVVGRSWTGSTRRGCGGGSRTVASATVRITGRRDDAARPRRGGRVRASVAGRRVEPRRDRGTRRGSTGGAEPHRRRRIPPRRSGPRSRRTAPGALVARPAIDPAVITPESFHDVVWRDDPRLPRSRRRSRTCSATSPPGARPQRRRAAALEPLFARGRMVREYADLFRRTVAARAERSAAFLDASLSAALRDREEAETATAALRDAVTGLLRADRALAAERGRAAAADAVVDDLASALVRITAMLAPANVPSRPSRSSTSRSESARRARRHRPRVGGT
jgi:hypothetical protein